MKRVFSLSRLLPTAGALVFSMFVFAGTAQADTFMSPVGGGPSNGQFGVPVDARVDRALTVTGSQLTLSGAKVNTTTVTLKANTGNLQAGAGTGSNLCTTVTIEWQQDIVCNHNSLSPNTWYTFKILAGSSGVKSQTGYLLDTNRTYVFQTGGFQGGADFLPPPTILGGVPRAGAVVPINAKLRVWFNVGGTGSTTMRTSGVNSVLSPDNVFIAEVVNGEPQETNLLACASTANCNMSWNSTGSELIVTPGKKAPAASIGYNATGALVAGHKYLFVVEGGGGPGGSPGVRNTVGGQLMGPPFFVIFTATGADSVGPSVRAVYPSSGSTLANRATYDISIGFSEAIDPTTVTGGSILLYKETSGSGSGLSPAADTLITGTYVSYTSKDNTAHISPSALLDAESQYYIVVTTNIKDISGNALPFRTVRAFWTGTRINAATPPTADTVAPQITAVKSDNFSIAVTFSKPMKFDSTVNGARTSSTDMNAVNNSKNWKLTMTPEGFTYDLSANGRTISYDPPTRTAVFGGLMMMPGQSFVIQAKTSSGVVRVKDLSSNLLNPSGSTGSVRNMNETMGMMLPGQDGDFNFFQNGLRPKMVIPMSPVAGATTNYDVMFALTRVVPLGGKIILTFPNGFSTASSCATTAAIPDNNDINGPGTGTVGIASIACDNVDRSITVTTNGAATLSSDMLHFVVQGIVNSPVSTSPGAEGYRIDMKTKSSTGVILESASSMPIVLKDGGSRSVSGTVYKDNGDGGGISGDQVKNGTEPGVQNMKVCLSGPGMNNCTTTAANGTYSFTSLNDGFYNIMMPPVSSGSIFVGGSSFRDARPQGASVTGIDFGLSTTTQTITVTVTGIPNGTDIDVFAFNPNSNKSGNIVREVTYSASSAEVTLPVSTGTWNVGIGPKMNKDPSLGAGSMMDFTFMPPPPKTVKVPSGGNATTSFTLAAANQQIKGTVANAAGTALGSAFIMARPSTTTGQSGKESGAQSKQDGAFSVFVSTGAYIVQAMMPGMPPSSSVPVLVKENSNNDDGNTAADVYMNGSLVNGSNLLNLVILQGGLSIAGQVLDDSGNSVPYAHVMAKKKTSGSFNGIFRDAPANSTGNFTVYVEPGTWDLTAFVPGFGELPSTTVVITSNSVTGQNLQATSSNFGTVTGTVLQAGSAVAGAFVNIYGSNGGNHTVTDTEGKYSMKVRAGTYTIDGFLPGTGPTSALSNVTVTGGATATGKNLTIGAAGQIFVTLSGVTDAFVRAEDSNGKGNGTNSATATGVYTLTVAAGTYTVRAQNPALGLIGSQAVTVTAGQSSFVSFTPATTYSVSGQVVSDSAICKNGAGVSLSDSTSGRVKVITTDESGNYSLSLPNGTYRIIAGNSGCVDENAPSTVVVNGAALSTGTNRLLSLATSTISGRVTLDGATVTLPTKVFARNSDNKFAFADVSSGSYTLRVTAGDWYVIARSEGYASAEVTVTAPASSQNLALAAISGYTRYDPQTTSITPTAGAEVKNSDIGSRFSLTLPAGAMGTSSNAGSVLTQPTSAFITQTSTAQTVGSVAVEVIPKDENGNTKSKLDVAGTITIPITTADLVAAGISDITKLSLSTWNDQAGWVPMETTVDSTNNTLTAPVQHFSVIIATSPRGGGAAAASTSTSTTSTSTTGRGGGGGGRRSAYVPVLHTAGQEAPLSQEEVISLVSVSNFLKVAVGGREMAFKDVPTVSWFADSVATVIKAGLASGYRDSEGNLTGMFGPDNKITYAELAKMAVEGAKLPKAVKLKVKNRFARSHWSKQYISKAEELQAAVFTERLNLDSPATRGAVMQTIVDILGIKEPEPIVPTQTGGTLTQSGAAITQSGSILTGTGATVPAAASAPLFTPAKFTDLPANYKYAAAVRLLGGLGIVSGDTTVDGKLKGTIRPNAPINRAEVAKIFTKLIEMKYIK